MIHQGSRYRRKDAYVSNDPSRSDHPLEGVAPHEIDPDDVRREHRIVTGDRLDQLAQLYYGDPLKYWLICDANDVLFPEDLLIPGRLVRIPRNRVL